MQGVAKQHSLRAECAAGSHILLAGCALHAALQQYQTAAHERLEESGSQHALAPVCACAQSSQRVPQVWTGQVQVSCSSTGSKAGVSALLALVHICYT